MTNSGALISFAASFRESSVFWRVAGERMTFAERAHLSRCRSLNDLERGGLWARRGRIAHWREPQDLPFAMPTCTRQQEVDVPARFAVSWHKVAFGEMGQEAELASKRVVRNVLCESGFQFLYPYLGSALRREFGLPVGK